MKKRIVMCLMTTWSLSALGDSENSFRDYEHAPPHVKRFYEDQHQKQTYAFAKNQRDDLISIMNLTTGIPCEGGLAFMEQAGNIKRMSVWQALMELDKLVDESDPDLTLPNSIHAFQTAEAIRKASPELPDWMVLVGLIHDIGKVDALLRKVPQWAVVGDTFPLGCAFSEKNIYADYFKSNPDRENPDYNTEFGIYQAQVGLDHLVMSWGHDEFAYQVLKEQSLLPKEALAMLRFHSFYSMHKEGAYQHLLSENDYTQIQAVKAFSPFDLYSKSPTPPDIDALKPYYQALINKYFPPRQGEQERKLIWPVLSPVN